MRRQNSMRKALLLVSIAAISVTPQPPGLAKVFGPNEARALLERTPCVFSGFLDKQAYSLGPGFGYNYDSLESDLNKWRQSPFVHVDSIGASVQRRALWNLTIKDTAAHASPEFLIAIHARTHPMEVQSSWVTNEMIKILIGDSAISRMFRKNCVFSIIPMYNPDGVELGLNTENANNVDLESDWSSVPLQPEVSAIKNFYDSLMKSALPIRVALNMHSSSLGGRYFVYHDAAGTSAAYAEDEKRFIACVRTHWTGISDWNAFVSWTTGTPNYYPESWFWLSYGSSVMALTYEDLYGAPNGFDSAAVAILHGVADYLGISNITGIADGRPGHAMPARQATGARNAFMACRRSFTVPGAYRPAPCTARLYDLQGKRRAGAAILHKNMIDPGRLPGMTVVKIDN